ncbi:hypothetical protein GY45DRAFT_1311085 [Cubamyces sp. BRFM 1775]|nr:hypothetical protein GY45DRAFT_1311085 [Cubamyces sp. BRFM 1775]
MDARASCWEKDMSAQNDEVICVIDISDIKRPAYCFVSERGGPVLSAYQYLHLRADHLFGSPPPEEYSARGHTEEYPRVLFDRNGFPDSTQFPIMGTLMASGMLPVNPHDNEEEQELHSLIDYLKAFWALVDLAGYPLVAAASLRQVWPTETFLERPGALQLQIPKTDGLPMPLDIVISLYIGFAPADELEAIKRDFEAEEPHIAIGKAILPPYDRHDDPKRMTRRCRVIRQILESACSFEYVIRPSDPRPFIPPPSSISREAERLSHWYLECLKLGVNPLYMSPWGLLAPFLTFTPTDNTTTVHALQKIREWMAYMALPVRAQLGGILHPAQVVKFFLMLHSARVDAPFPDSLLDVLSLMIQELGELTFIDLSGLSLTPLQIVEIARRHPGVEALSLSRNFKVSSHDLPFIIASIPSLRRLHVMHMIGPDIQELILDLPDAFRQLESLLCPALLTCPNDEHPPTRRPTSFTFYYSTRISALFPPPISISFSTPAQIVQALTEILPHAFREYDYSESAELCDEYGAKNVLNSRMLPRVPFNSMSVPRYYGFPFYMSGSMLIFAAFACGLRRPGEPWSKRRIVHLPTSSHLGQGYNIPREDGEKAGNWIFYLDWDSRRHKHKSPGRNMHAFVYCEIIQEAPGAPESSSQDTENEFESLYGWSSMIPKPEDLEGPSGPDPTQRSPESTFRMLPNPAVYDLRGYLRCMADEGRPLPNREAAKQLEEILETRDKVTGELVCPLAKPHEIPILPFGRLRGEARNKVLNSLFPAQRPGQQVQLFTLSSGISLF